MKYRNVNVGRISDYVRRNTAMTKKQLTEMGLDEAMASKVMEAWTASLSGSYVLKTKLDDAMSDLKKANERVTALETQVGDLKTQMDNNEQKYKDDLKASTLKLAAMGVLTDAYDSDLVYSQLDTSKMTVDDKGKVSGLDEQIQELKKSKPFLFKAASGEEGPKQKGKGLGIRVIGGEPTPAPQDKPAKKTTTTGQAVAKLLAKQRNNSETAGRKAAEENYWN